MPVVCTAASAAGERLLLTLEHCSLYATLCFAVPEGALQLLDLLLVVEQTLQRGGCTPSKSSRVQQGLGVVPQQAPPHQ